MFKLSNKLGGRSEVVNAPALELLKYMELEVEEMREEYEREKAKMYMNYLSNIFSQPLQEKPSKKYLDAKKEFENMLQPEGKQKEPTKYEWDFDPEDYLPSKQGEG